MCVLSAQRRLGGKRGFPESRFIGNINKSELSGAVHCSVLT